MARDLSTDFVVEDSIPLFNTLVLSELEILAGQHNPSLQAAMINQRIADLRLKEVKANRYPQLTLNSGYNFFEFSITSWICPVIFRTRV